MNTLEHLKEEVLQKAEAEMQRIEKDFFAGENDCKSGIYDKWYRYNRKDDGSAYDAGWMEQNRKTQNETVRFI